MAETFFIMYIYCSFLEVDAYKPQYSPGTKMEDHSDRLVMSALAKGRGEHFSSASYCDLQSTSCPACHLKECAPHVWRPAKFRCERQRWSVGTHRHMQTLPCPVLTECLGPPFPPEGWKLAVSRSLLINTQTYSSFLVVSDASRLTFEPHSHYSQCPGT